MNLSVHEQELVLAFVLGVSAGVLLSIIVAMLAVGAARRSRR